MCIHNVVSSAHLEPCVLGKESVILKIICGFKGRGHANFDADFFVPMDSLGDAQVKNKTFKLLKFH